MGSQNARQNSKRPAVNTYSELLLFRTALTQHNSAVFVCVSEKEGLHCTRLCVLFWQTCMRDLSRTFFVMREHKPRGSYATAGNSNSVSRDQHNEFLKTWFSSSLLFGQTYGIIFFPFMDPDKTIDKSNVNVETLLS